jgi:hypothetical protein
MPNKVDTIETLYSSENVGQHTVPSGLEEMLGKTDNEGGEDALTATQQMTQLLSGVDALVSKMGELTDVVSKHFSTSEDQQNTIVESHESPPTDAPTTPEGNAIPIVTDNPGVEVPPEIIAMEEKHGRPLPMEGEEESNFIENELSKTGMTIGEWARQAPWIIKTGQPEILDRIKDWSIYDQVKTKVDSISD